MSLAPGPARTLMDGSLENQGCTQLTARQTAIFDQVRRYHAALGEACPAAYVAKRLGLHHETVRDHFAALHRKGWLQAENSPATPRRRFLLPR